MTEVINVRRPLIEWRKDALPVLIFLLLPLLCFPELFFRQETLYRGDLTWIHYPLRVFAAEQWRSGHVPLWNPYVLSGGPLLAEAQIGVLQPLNSLFLLPIPAYRALTLFVSLNLTLAATFTYLLARSLGIGRAGATLGGLGFGFGGFLMAQVTNLNIMTGGVWLPLVFASCAWALRTGLPAAALLAGIPLALQIFAAQPELWFYTILFLISYAMYDTGRTLLSPSQGASRPRRVALTWTLLALMLVSGLLLAAPQVLPTLELQRLSVRSSGVESGLPIFSIPPVQWITLVLPSVFGTPVGPSYQGLKNTNFEETHVYIGILSLLLVPFSWRARHRPEVPFLWLAALGGAVLSMGHYTPLYNLLQHLPGFSLFRGPARWSLIASLALTLLASYGFDSFLDRPGGRRTRLILLGLWLVALAMILAAWLVREPVVQWTESLPERNQITYTLRLLMRRGLFEVSDGIEDRIIVGPLAWWVLPSVALVSRLGVGVALLVAYATRRLPRQTFVIGATALVIIDLSLSGGSAVNRLTGADHWEQLSGGASYLKEREGEGTARFYAFATSKEKNVVAGLKHYFPSVHHLFASSGQSPLRLARYDDFMQQAHPLVMLSLTGTRYVLNEGRLTPDAESVLPLTYHDEEWYVYEHQAALPHTFVVRQAVVASNAEEALSYLRNRDFDPLSMVILETDGELPPLALDAPGDAHSEPPTDQVAITRYTPSEVEIQANLTDSGFLVLLDNYYPGWHVYVDGQPQTIMRAYTFARAVYLNDGQHMVRFVYRPFSFYGGLGLAAMSLLIIAGSVWLTQKGRSGTSSSLDTR